MSQSCLTISNGRSRRMAEFHCIVKKERTTINCPLFISYKFDFQSLSKCSCRQPQCPGYGVSLCYNILPSPNRITITSSSEIASMLHGTYPRRYVFSSSLPIACCMRLVSFFDLVLRILFFSICSCWHFFIFFISFSVNFIYFFCPIRQFIN